MNRSIRGTRLINFRCSQCQKLTHSTEQCWGQFPHCLGRGHLPEKCRFKNKSEETKKASAEEERMLKAKKAEENKKKKLNKKKEKMKKKINKKKEKIKKKLNK